MNENIELLRKALKTPWNLKDDLHEFFTSSEEECLFVTTNVESLGYEKKKNDFEVGLFDRTCDGHIFLFGLWSFLNSTSSSWRTWVDDQLKSLLDDALKMEAFGYDQGSLGSYFRRDNKLYSLVFRNQKGYSYSVHDEHGNKTSTKYYSNIEDAVVFAESHLLKKGQEYCNLSPQLRDLLIMRGK